MKIKICGITQLEDALFCAQQGVWALGFNFYPESKRYIGPTDAKAIIQQLPKQIIPVGIFVNSSAEEINQIAASTGIKLAQLHGDEAPEIYEQCDIPTIKVIRPTSTGDLNNLQQFSMATYILVDAAGAERGGSGVAANWDLANQVKRYGPLILAGGINPNNISQALIQTRPFAVDMASGVEREPGIKDHDKILAVMKAASAYGAKDV